MFPWFHDIINKMFAFLTNKVHFFQLYIEIFCFLTQIRIKYGIFVIPTKNKVICDTESIYMLILADEACHFTSFFNPWRAFSDSGRPRKTHLGGPLSTVVANRWQAIATPFLASLRLPALPRPRFGVNGLGMSRATFLESGVVIRFEFFELQPFKVDQFFRGFFWYFPTLIKLNITS